MAEAAEAMAGAAAVTPAAMIGLVGRRAMARVATVAAVIRATGPNGTATATAVAGVIRVAGVLGVMAGAAGVTSSAMTGGNGPGVTGPAGAERPRDTPVAAIMAATG
jgi:hypothetical protein